MLELGFQILCEDGPVLVVNKPPGLPTQAPPGIESLEMRIKGFLKARDNPPHDVYLGVPHRLDRPASGAMVFATRRRTTQKLAKQFEYREVKKLYWACVEGRVEPAEGTWQDHLWKVYGKPQAEVVPADHPEGRLAVLHYRTLTVGLWGTWLEITLETGRTHQIRVQAASRGYPVLGDSQYGAKTPFGPHYEDERLRAIALHARTLEFVHPGHKKPVSLTADPPDFWPTIEGPFPAA